ncbi:unnamed protein product [Linum tenue]|uniref:RRM domain-containing protein n=2 Tax=Linum tenue TaxID=586396 RepID=A0AAV0RCI8_9ROSI|nr:unnamed protein product [Linum tenue]CAI0555195.1 unnamed protein product [Linum tenue]
MDFDEIEYLEKTVEEAEDRDGSAKKSKREGVEKSERSYRKRDAADEDATASRKRSRGGKDEENGREKDRHRRDRDRDREKDRDKEKDRRDRDKEREEGREKRERSRSESKSRRERSRSRSKSRRERSRSRYSDREKEVRERERDVELRDSGSRRVKDKKEAVEPEADPERDQRTVFAYQMPLKATERDVYEFFSKAGKVRDVRLIMDRNSRRSKGVGYIEFYDVMSVPMAIALSGQPLFGQPVMVKPSEAEKNLVQSNATGATTGPYGPVDRKLYVGNLHFNMTEMQLRQLFEPFGTVELVQLPLDLETGQCKGFGFVQFAQVESAKEAQTHLNGKLEIAGRTLKVSSVTEHGGPQEPGAKSADFDDDDGGGLSLNAQSRAMLMQKLDRSGIATSISGSLGVPMLNGSAQNPQTMALQLNGQAALRGALPVHVLPSPAFESIGKPSVCLLLQNMFDPSTETEPDFDVDIKDDVEEECSKYGHVKHIYVEKNSAGFVYLRFDTVEAAARAQAAMHMRWFARRSISATFMPPHEYEAKFPNSH